MGQFFTDDIDSLLKSGHGDSARLAKIKAEFESTKLVSIDDRKYVEGLLARYVQPAEQSKTEKKPEPPKRIVPPPPPPRNPPTLLEVKQQPKKEEKIPKLEGKTKLRNIVIAVCATVFAVLVVSFIAMNQDAGNPSVTSPTLAKGLELDSAAYVKGDIISVSGKIKAPAQTVKLVISNPTGSQIWSETVTVKPSGIFSTLVLAGGDGWDQAGKYTISGNSESLTFSFDPSG